MLFIFHIFYWCLTCKIFSYFFVLMYYVMLKKVSNLIAINNGIVNIEKLVGLTSYLEHTMKNFLNGNTSSALEKHWSHKLCKYNLYPNINFIPFFIPISCFITSGMTITWIENKMIRTANQSVNNLDNQLLKEFFWTFWFEIPQKFTDIESVNNPLNTGRKLNIHKMFRRRSGRVHKNVQFTSFVYGEGKLIWSKRPFFFWVWPCKKCPHSRSFKNQ